MTFHPTDQSLILYPTTQFENPSCAITLQNILIHVFCILFKNNIIIELKLMYHKIHPFNVYWWVLVYCATSIANFKTFSSPQKALSPLAVTPHPRLWFFYPTGLFCFGYPSFSLSSLHIVSKVPFSFLRSWPSFGDEPVSSPVCARPHIDLRKIQLHC